MTQFWPQWPHPDAFAARHAPGWSGTELLLGLGPSRPAHKTCLSDVQLHLQASGKQLQVHDVMPSLEESTVKVATDDAVRTCDSLCTARVIVYYPLAHAEHQMQSNSTIFMVAEHAFINNRVSAYLQNYSKDDGGDAFTNEEPLPAMETKGTIQQQQCCSQGTSYDLAQSCGCSDAGVGYPKFTSIQEQGQVVPHACMNDQHKQTHTCSLMN